MEPNAVSGCPQNSLEPEFLDPHYAIDPRVRFDKNSMTSAVAALRLSHTSLPSGIWHFGWVHPQSEKLHEIHHLAALAAGNLLLSVPSAFAETPTQRGEYLATIMDCTGCHTPRTFLGKPDLQRPLAGSEVRLPDPRPRHLLSP